MCFLLLLLLLHFALPLRDQRERHEGGAPWLVLTYLTKTPDGGRQAPAKPPTGHAFAPGERPPPLRPVGVQALFARQKRALPHF